MPRPTAGKEVPSESVNVLGRDMVRKIGVCIGCWEFGFWGGGGGIWGLGRGVLGRRCVCVCVTYNKTFDYSVINFLLS